MKPAKTARRRATAQLSATMENVYTPTGKLLPHQQRRNLQQHHISLSSKSSNNTRGSRRGSTYHRGTSSTSSNKRRSARKSMQTLANVKLSKVVTRLHVASATSMNSAGQVVLLCAGHAVIEDGPADLLVPGLHGLCCPEEYHAAAPCPQL
jgi:hypothetical protein